jgi:hypothetical protein
VLAGRKDSPNGKHNYQSKQRDKNDHFHLLMWRLSKGLTRELSGSINREAIDLSA